MYQNFVAGKGRRDGSGQFFTPAHICNLMAEISMNRDLMTKENINDCACGSGRTLLAAHSLNLTARCFGEDLDGTCVRMCTINFLLHGIVGEVICHNSLEPDSFYFGYRINAHLNNPFSNYFGIPHIEVLEAEDSQIICSWKNRLKQQKEAKEQPVIEEISEIKEITTTAVTTKPQQLDLF